MATEAVPPTQYTPTASPHHLAHPMTRRTNEGEWQREAPVKPNKDTKAGQNGATKEIVLLPVISWAQLNPHAETCTGPPTSPDRPTLLGLEVASSRQSVALPASSSNYEASDSGSLNFVMAAGGARLTNHFRHVLRRPADPHAHKQSRPPISPPNACPSGMAPAYPAARPASLRSKRAPSAKRASHPRPTTVRRAHALTQCAQTDTKNNSHNGRKINTEDGPPM